MVWADVDCDIMFEGVEMVGQGCYDFSVKCDKVDNGGARSSADWVAKLWIYEVVSLGKFVSVFHGSGVLYNLGNAAIASEAVIIKGVSKNVICGSKHGTQG